MQQQLSQDRQSPRPDPPVGQGVTSATTQHVQVLDVATQIRYFPGEPLPALRFRVREPMLLEPIYHPSTKQQQSSSWCSNISMMSNNNNLSLP